MARWTCYILKDLRIRYTISDQMQRRLVPFLLLIALSGHAPGPHDYGTSGQRIAQADAQILVFSRTQGFRHASIGAGVEAIRKLGRANDFEVTATEDPAIFSDQGLAAFDAVVFLNTTGNVLSRSQQAAFEKYIARGGGFVGVHSAADTEYGWAWYGGLVGAYFASHPHIQQATVLVPDDAHPSTASLPRRWRRVDEWYNYRNNPRDAVHVLAVLDERTYTGGSQPADHPISWCHEYGGGRSWYTGMGHTAGTYSESRFLEHLQGGIAYAMGQGGDCSATQDIWYEQTVLDESPVNPMELVVLPGGAILYVELYGTVKKYDPATQTTSVALKLNVFHEFEDGLTGIALDPAFASNGWVYLFYSPAGNNAVQHVSRFAFDGEKIDPQSERILLEIPVQRDQCCHTAGALAFDPDGNLLISTGDNTNPFESDGYSPIDERAGRSPWDAQKSSADTNDLRGKILRIKPMPDGTYAIPEGNLFPVGTDRTRPEIYIMGLRNPFRFSIDPETGWLYWGDIGPDAGGENPARGPRGYDEWNRTREAGHFGWPHCIADNKPYRDYDFRTGRSGNFFNCAAPVNDSPNNTGLRNLPPAREAWIWYPYGASAEFPQLDAGSGGRAAAAGPVYHFDPDAPSAGKLPRYFDKTLFIYEWSRNWIKEVKFDDQGDILAIQPFLPSFRFNSLIDMELGPDGALYLLEWGSDKFGRNNTDARLLRIAFTPLNKAPVALASASPDAGPLPLTVQFDARDSYDPDSSEELAYAWDFTNDGQPDATGPAATWTFAQAGRYDVRLTVRDGSDGVGVTTISVVAGNSRPVPSIVEPAHGSFFAWGQSVSYVVRVEDAEDGSTDAGIDCQEVRTQPAIGHDDHSHAERIHSGCAGTFTLASSHGADGSDVFYLIETTWTDQGGDANAPLEGQAISILQPLRKEAEHLRLSDGLAVVSASDAQGLRAVSGITAGEYLVLDPANLAGIKALSYRFHPTVAGTKISVRADSTDGPQISVVAIADEHTGKGYVDVQASLIDPGGTHALYFVFENDARGAMLGTLNYVDFLRDGTVSASAAPPEVENRFFPPFPNPANAAVQFQYALREPQRVRMEVYTVLGARVATLVDEMQQGGTHTLTMQTGHLASGTYVCRLRIGRERFARAFAIAR